MYCHISYISLNLIQIQRTIEHGDEDKCKCRKTFPQLKAKKIVFGIDNGKFLNKAWVARRCQYLHMASQLPSFLFPMEDGLGWTQRWVPHYYPIVLSLD